MGRWFNYDSPIIQTLNKIVDYVILSIIWLLFSMPIITFGASTTALYYTVNKVIRHDRSHIWREFWRAFKSNFKQSTIAWLILFVLLYVLGVDCIFLYNMVRAGAVSGWILAPFIGLTIFVLMWAIYTFAYIARFRDGLKTIMKNSAFMALGHLPRSILLVLIFAGSVVIFIILPITIVILPTFSMFFMTGILESIFRKYMSADDLAAEAEKNQVYNN